MARSSSSGPARSRRGPSPHSITKRNRANKQLLSHELNTASKIPMMKMGESERKRESDRESQSGESNETPCTR